MNPTQSKRNAELQEALRVIPSPNPELGHAETGTTFTRFIAGLREPSARRQQRRELAELSEYALQDIGLSRAQVMAELSKPMWR